MRPREESLAAKIQIEKNAIEDSSVDFSINVS